MTTARVVVALVLLLVIFIGVCWYLEGRRERFVKSLLVGDWVQFQFESEILCGTVIEKHKNNLQVYAGTRSYRINNDRVIREKRKR